jgi:radical SAM-linked protein
MLVSFASPLPVGQAGSAELADVTLRAECSEQECLAALKRALPPGLPAARVRLVDDNHPKLMAMLRTASYLIGFDSELDARPILDAAPSFMKRESIKAVRVTKSGETPCDIKPMLHELAAFPALNALRARVSFTQAQTLKPDLLIRALMEFSKAGVGQSPALSETPRYGVIRTGLFGERFGQPIPLIDC